MRYFAFPLLFFLFLPPQSCRPAFRSLPFLSKLVNDSVSFS